MEETVIEPELFTEADFAEAQTEESSSPAVEEATKQPTSQNEATDSTADSNASESQTGDEIEEFLAKKGIKSDDPDALRKVADMYRNVEKDYSRKAQEKAQLERQLERYSQQATPATNSNDPMERVKALEQQIAADRQLQSVREWKAAKNPTPEVEQKMIEYLSQPIILNGVPQTDNQGNPLNKFFALQHGMTTLDDVYKIVGGDSVKTEALKQELKTAIASEAAAKQSAKSITPLAANSTQFAQPKTAEDAFLAGFLED